MTGPVLVLLAHGTRDATGAVEIERLADLLRADLTVAVGFADVVEPTLATVLAGVPGRAVVVPAFLAAGYHVRVDVPAQLAATGRTDVLLADPLGPDPALIEVAHQRLVRAGWRLGDRVVLAAAGSSDPRARAEVVGVAAMLGRIVDRPVAVGHATGTPEISEVVAELRRAQPGRVAVASWLLAPGLFQRKLADAGADLVAEPLGADPGVAAVVRARYHAALSGPAGPRVGVPPTELGRQ